MAGEPAQLAAGLAGRFEIVREVGHGGMATVYLARDAKHGRLVALKVLRSELAAANRAPEARWRPALTFDEALQLFRRTIRQAGLPTPTRFFLWGPID